MHSSIREIKPAITKEDFCTPREKKDWKDTFERSDYQEIDPGIEKTLHSNSFFSVTFFIENFMEQIKEEVAKKYVFEFQEQSNMKTSF